VTYTRIIINGRLTDIVGTFVQPTIGLQSQKGQHFDSVTTALTSQSEQSKVPQLSMSKGGTYCVYRSCKQLDNEGVTFFEELTRNFVRVFSLWMAYPWYAGKYSACSEDSLHQNFVSSPRITWTWSAKLLVKLIVYKFLT
jgi:hypothetical protein